MYAASKTKAGLAPRVPSRFASLTLLILASAATSACDRDSALAPSATPPSAPGPALGLVEVTISGLGTSQVISSVLSVPDPGALERARNTRSGGGLAQLSLIPSANADASGDGTIQLEPISTGSFTAGERGNGGVRYLYATFRVRNAQANGTAYDSPRQNLTFLAVSTASSLDGTAITKLQRFDGTAAAPGLAAEVMPTGALTQDPTGEVVVRFADVLQVLGEDEAAAVLADAAEGVQTAFPYGFIVRNPATPNSRVLSADPTPGQFDGVVTFAFKVPLQATPGDDPFAISAVFQAVDDTETRVTESLEEQGTSSAQAAADALGGGAAVTLLGNSATLVSGHHMRRICRVRTAGTDPNAPAATMVDANGCTTGSVTLPDHVIVVNGAAAPGGNGRYWSTAFHNLQDALACVRTQSGAGKSCEGVSEIWVAAGTYKPTDRALRNDSFQLPAGTALFGGFAGTESTRDQRDWVANRTVMSGEIGDAANAADNSWHVVYLDGNATPVTATTVIDGFTITGGHAVGASEPYGGGLYCNGYSGACSPTIRNVIFTGNTAVNGGAMYNYGNQGVSSPVLEHVVFSGNIATENGGAMYNYGAKSGSTSSPKLVNVAFSENISTLDGGAMYNDGTSGGTSSPTLVNVIFWNNRNVTGSGGRGAGMYNNGTAGTSSPTLVNAVFHRNSAATNGGAMYNNASSSGASQPRITNSILWFNLENLITGGIANSGTGAVPTIENSIVEYSGGSGAGWTGKGIDGGGNLGTDPLFVAGFNAIGADGIWGSADDGLRLKAGSPAIDAGKNAVFNAGGAAAGITTDFAGASRTVNGTVDLGAYEKG